MSSKDVVIIGAGPYGLSVAAHLRHAGIDVHVLGRPMVFWKESMPEGMLLRSGIEASNISAPGTSLSIAGYERAIGRKLDEPLPVSDFIAYGEWFQKQVVPNLDSRYARSVSQGNQGFRVTLEDEECIDAKTVVLALGIGYFVQRPEQFRNVPRELVSHSSELHDLSRFRGKRVAVIGKGQSGLEYAALLREQKADVRIVTRSSGIKYLKPRWKARLFRRMMPGPLRPLSHAIRPPTDLGDIKTARMIAHPDKFRRQSPAVQETLLKSTQKPIGSHWLRSRLEGISVISNAEIRSVETSGNQLRLVLSNGATDLLDHVVLATGYDVNLSNYPLLDSSLRQAIRQTEDGYPILTTGLETSVKGLHMAGVIGEKALGPTLRFVTGTSNAGPRLAASIVSRLR